MTDSLKKEQRSRYLKNLIKEAVLNVLAEQEMEQQPQASSVPPAAPAPSPETNPLDPSVAPPLSDEPEVFTVESMVDKLNVLRGGKSFTDPEIFGQLTTFFNGLSDEQKTSLDYLLTELSRVVVGGEAEEAGLEQPATGRQQASQPPPPSAPAPASPATAPASAPAPVTPTI